MTILVIAEHDNQQLKPSTLHTLSAAQELKDDVDVLVMGTNCEAVANEVAKANVKNVLLADNKVYEHQLAENCSELIADLAKDYQYLLAPATTFGKNILPRAAALLDVSMLSDVTKVLNADTFERPIYAGNITATVQTNDAIKVMTIRHTAFARASLNDAKVAEVKRVAQVFEDKLSSFVSHTLTQSERPELTAARVIISGGRGLKSAENFKLLEDVADQLNAAIGASRAAVDAGFAPNDYQVGQTGKIVAPDLYIAVGISGAIQHLAGMKESKVIVVINNDPEAPIFQVSDYGLVGDLFKVLPELKTELAKVV